MVRRVLKRILGFMKSASDLVVQLLQTPKGESTPDPAKEAAKRVREAMPASTAGEIGGAGYFAVRDANRRFEEVAGKVLAEGHKKARKQS